MPSSPSPTRPVPVARRARPLAAALAAVLLLPGCGFFAPTVSIRHVGPDTVYDALNRNALNSDAPSAATREVLQDYMLDGLAEDEPLEALRRMHAVALAEPSRRNLFALSELAYHAARRYDDRDAYLAAATYAWLYLLGDEDPQPPSPYDRRFRWACDLYNSGLQRSFAEVGGEYARFEPAVRELPVGRLRVTLDASRTPWDDVEYRSYLAGDDFLVEGLTLRLRDAGLGVPLVGVRDNGRPGPAPAIGFLRLHGGLAGLQDGLDATIELHSGFDAQFADVSGRKVPLESDLSIMLAALLNESPVWKFSLRGLLEGNSAVTENRLLTIMQPTRGRIPVVFVHGTASNPAYWAEMFNSLLGDPDLRADMQYWFFQYASGNPILYSAMTLRRELRRTLDELDPQGTDPALRQVILVGHSQGGLLVRLLTCDGSVDWFEKATGTPLAEAGLATADEALLREAFDFRAFPEVTRAVFVSTPHKGSFRADTWYGRWIAKFISLPVQLSNLVQGQHASQRLELPEGMGGRLPTALDNMNPASPLLARLAETPPAPGVALHSIVCIGDADPADAAAVAAANDGVVEYSSAHYERAGSERLIPWHHSCQDHPEVVREVRRILREHLAAFRAARP
jgi:pimeloyl-ACP methyl ester carboxylesterase